MASQVFIATPDNALSRAMVRRLARVGAFEVAALPAFEGLRAGDVVVTTSPGCPATLCALLAEQGVRVVVLATLPSAHEQAEYQRAGSAAYLPMAIDLGPLQRELGRLVVSC